MQDGKAFPRYSLVLIVLSTLFAFCCLDARAMRLEGLTGPRQSEGDASLVPGRSPGQDERAKILETFDQMDLYFVQNRGQLDEAVRYYERGQGHALFLTREEIVFSFGRGNKASVLRVTPVGKREQVEVVAEEPQAAEVNIFIGNDPEKWRTEIATCGKVRYREVYAGVDLVFHGSRRHLEFDFEVSPGVDPKTIVLALDGADKLELTPEGDLDVQIRERRALYRKPVSFQLNQGARREVSSNYRIEGDNRLCFDIGDYDRTKPLVIDPVLAYSTYLGGSGSEFSYIYDKPAIAVDGKGNAYVTGLTNSSDFPTKNPFQAVYGGGSDVFVTKLGPTGKALIYSTYLGGSGGDMGSSIAVDGDGNVYVAGGTCSEDFPLKNPFQSELGGYYDVFVTKLGPTGKVLVYSTYLGGNGNDMGCGIAVDGAGSAYIAGYAGSSDFPLKNPFQAEYGGGSCDAFVSKLNPTGKALVYSTYLGGSFADFGFAIAVGQAGNAYVTGSTRSDDFPVVNAVQAELGGGLSDAFVTKLGPTGKALVYSTYLGGSAGDGGDGIAVDAGGYAYVAGGTVSTDFPTKNAFQATYGGGYCDAFVTKLGPGGRALVYSTYLGGKGSDNGYGIAVSSTGHAYVAGVTDSTDFPIKNAFQAKYGGSYGDAFVAKLGPTGKALAYSSYLGGSGAETASGIALDEAGNAYVTGYTKSSDFPTKNAFQPKKNGDDDSYDAFITKIAP